MIPILVSTATFFSKSTDYGASWQPIGKGLPSSWLATTIVVAPNNPNLVFAAWQGCGLYRSSDGGITWQESDQGLMDTEFKKIGDYLRQPPLHKAVIDGNVNQVGQLLKQGANVNEVSETGMTPILWAATRGTPSMFKLLRRYGANINVNNKDNYMPLHLAVIGKNIPIIKLLLASGANVNQKSESTYSGYETPLTLSFTSLAYGEVSKPKLNKVLEVLAILIENGADLNSLYIMRRAIEVRQLPVVKFLYEKGAVLTDKNDNTNLADLAIADCQPEILDFLMSQGLNSSINYQAISKGCAPIKAFLKERLHKAINGD
ncbi:ankyrin repeat domain-containing protein [Methylocucumis oryzae]|uniref:ankyrin repeat domain-containing protein n=1 Tax=Methylocucumis oryzae TaxID=1632867 RepID=UPI0012FF1672|nr:ankyrin repeat domain-containing protein [Methylocucumis oryzae]